MNPQLVHLFTHGAVTLALLWLTVMLVTFGARR